MPFLGKSPARGLVGATDVDDDAIDSQHYAAGSIDTAHIAANQVDGTLTKDALIADYSDVTITASDLIMYGDATDSNNTKRDTVQGILDLAGGGGTSLVSTSDVTSNTTTTTITGLDSSADWWQLIISGCTLSAISQPEIQYITSGGTQNSNYTHATSSNNQGSTGTSNNAGSATEIPLTSTTSYRSGPENTIQIIVDIFDPATSQMTDIWWRMTGGNDNHAQSVPSWGMGRREVDEAVTGISFSQSAGDHQARFTLYKWVLS